MGPRSELRGSVDAGPGEALAFRLKGGREAGAAARRAVDTCDGDLSSPVRDRLLLPVAELVANAVRHGGVGPNGLLRVEQVRPRFTRDDAGWGLVLVDRIATRWGVTHGPSRTCVWFEIDFE
jgi:hypothetical protein